MHTHFSRPAFFEGARDIAPMLIGIVPFGIVCGIGAITAGASPIAALAMSMIMFSGAAQIIAVQLLAGGAPFAVILLSCLVVSLRLVMYSASIIAGARCFPSSSPIRRSRERSSVSRGPMICAPTPRIFSAAARCCG